MQTRCRVFSPPFSISARRFGALVFAALCLLLLAGCGSRADHSSGVQLILSTEQISPGTTFQLRFDEPVASSGGAEESPLVFNPPIPGKFAWTSPRSGVFSPAEPLALATTYEARLRHGLRLPDGRYSPARLRRTFSTPAFGVINEYGPSPVTNAFSEPEFRVWFNADVKADAVAPKAAFISREGKFIPAAARQGIADDQHWRASPTWHDEFPGSDWFNRRADRDPDKPVGNLVVFSPLEPLRVGSNWTLTLSPGIPSADGRYRTAAKFERPVGNVAPFSIESVTAHHELGRPAWVALRFSKPLPDALTNSYVDYVQIAPRPTSLDATVRGNTLELTGNWRRGTHYALTVLRGLPAEEDFTLTQGLNFEVVAPPIPPRLFFPAFTADQFSGGNRTFPLLAVNIPTLRLRAKILDEHTAVHALRGYVGYRSTREDVNFRLDFDLVAGRMVCDLELSGSTEPDVAQEVKLDWDRLLSGRKAGVVFLEAEAAGRSYKSQALPGAQAIIQLTDLGLVWKTSAEQVQVFVFSYQTGRPISQAKVRVCSEDNVVMAETLTDDSGLATLPGGNGASRLTAQLGDDLHVVSLHEGNIPTWWFEATRWQSHYQDARRAVLFLDRGAYRPGETAYVKAIVRDLTAEGLKIPAGLTGMVACLDSRGRQFFATNVTLSPLGSCETAIPLPTGSRGQYSAVLRLPGCEPVQPFEVADFQPSAFEVQLSGQPAYQAQDAVKLSLNARYHFGKGLERARVRWWLLNSDNGFEPEGLEDFQFIRTWEEARWGRPRSDINEEGTAELNGSNLVVEVNAPFNLEFPQPRDCTWYAEVTDLNQQTVSKTFSFTRHSSRFYLGLKRFNRVLLPGQDLPVQALAVDTTGALWTNSVRARLALYRVDWVTVRLQGAGRSVRYRSEPTLNKIREVETRILPATGATGADRNVLAPSEPARADRNVRASSEFARAGGNVGASSSLAAGEPPAGTSIAGLRADDPGEYLLEITGNDEDGNPVAASITFNISDRASLAWNYRDEFELKLVPDKSAYAPGETALLLVKAPFSGEALVTVERERVLRSFRTRLEGNAPSLRIPIELGDAPNIYVSVTLLRGAAESPRQAREPEYRAGFCLLKIEDPAQRLKIDVTPAMTNAQPGEAVAVAVRVRDSGDRPVSGAEVTLYAVDEGVLMLTDYAAPDLHSVMFAPRSLAVSSSISLPLLLSEDPERLVFQNKGYPGGGGGKERLRQHFLACAFWAGSIYTDSQGAAAVSFNAPDSITRYRLIAVAHNARNQFGQGVSSVSVSKPLILEPALPQSVNVGDQLVARAVVLNQTEVAAPVVVSLELDSTATCDVPQLSQTVLVGASGSVPVDFPVTVSRTGTARWTWRARFASPGPDFADSVRSTLQVGTVSPLLREVHTLRVTTPQTNLLAQVNPQLLTGTGTCTVHIANTRLVTLSAAVDHLLHYPYGCAEQTSSSLLPWIVLQQNPVLLNFTGKDPVEAAATARAGIQRLLAMQTSSGGLAYWPGGNDPSLWISAYGTFVLAQARNAGLPVPPAEFANLLAYLKSIVLRSADADATCLALAALAAAGEPDAALHTRWFERRDTLSVENRALLALAIGWEGNRDMARALLHSPSRTNTVSAQFGSPTRARATQLLAWATCEPGAAESANLFAALEGERKQGHWITTQANGWALLAMTSYLREEEMGGKAELHGPNRPKAEPQTGAGEVKGTLSWAGQEQTVQISPGCNASSHVLPFDPTITAAPLVLSASGSDLFVQLRFESRLPGKPGPGQDHGFGLQRRYERLNDRNEPEPADALQVGDRVLVTLRLTSPQAAQYVALEDPLPGILEAINPEFRTQGGGLLSAKAAPLEDLWFSDYREIRADRVLFFADHVPAGQRVLRYVARVRAAGTVTAPAAKVEEMYNPERFGLSDAPTVSARGSK